MRPNQTEGLKARAAGSWLMLSVHFDALRAAPRAYLMACWWNLRGKRLRAKGQFAPLFSLSSKAYALWVLRQNKVEHCNYAIPTDAGPPIVALIDMGAGEVGLDDTLRSLSEQGVQALLVGGGGLPDLTEAAARIDWSQNPWLMPIAPGDTIAPVAVNTYREAITNDGPSLLYADDDLTSRSGCRTAPHFKPDWNSELFRHFDYLTGACVLRTSRTSLEALAGARHWARQLVMQAVEQKPPLHIRKMLHHRRVRPVPRVPAAPAVLSTDLPRVTVIIPTRNHVDLLRTCLEGVAVTKYPDVEVIVVDNNSNDPQTLAYLDSLDPAHIRVLRHGEAFNYSAINNRAAAEAQGQLLCLLNNDIEVITTDWLAIMATQALRNDVGAVGARLLYPDGRIQHAGVVTGVGNAAGHAHRFIYPDEEGYFYRHALPQFTAAVTAACLVVQRERFLSVGGLDEQNFAVAFNDVDLCLRLNQRGWQSLYEPRATLIHHESVSRGLDLDSIGAARFAGELAALKRLWGTETIVDPFHHPELSRASERFVVGL